MFVWLRSPVDGHGLLFISNVLEVKFTVVQARLDAKLRCDRFYFYLIVLATLITILRLTAALDSDKEVFGVAIFGPQKLGELRCVWAQQGLVVRLFIG